MIFFSKNKMVFVLLWERIFMLIRDFKLKREVGYECDSR